MTVTALAASDLDDSEQGADVIDLAARRPVALAEPQDTPPPANVEQVEQQATEAAAAAPFRAVHRVRHFATHPVTRGAARQVAYVATGARTLAQRRHDRGTARHERMMRLAEQQGDHKTALEWESRAQQHRKARHERRMAMLSVPLRLARALAVGVPLAAALLLAGGVTLAISSRRAGDSLVPLMIAVHVIRALTQVIVTVSGPAMAAAPWLALVCLWAVGRRAGSAPKWLATSADDDDLIIDESTIAEALKALRIPQITEYLKRGMPLQYLTPARRDGRGTHAVIRLPGVPAEQISARRAALAAGLHRAAKEVWPTTGTEAGILDLWIADKGALAEGAGEYPLLTTGFVDVFKGVPFGRILRGDPILAPVIERNTITGGMPGQGKSASARVIMAGAALDPTCELRIWVPDSNFDFEAFAPRCSRYVMGAEDEKIAEILTDLRALHAEVQARGRLLIKYEIPAVTRAIASRGVGLHPLVCLLEEAHVAIQHPKYGKEISQLLVDIVKLGRKRAVHLIVSTQAPTKDSMPRDVTRNCSNGLAFAVGDHVANDGLLGQGAYRAGHRATELIPGVDRGTCVAKGLSGERSDIVQVYYLDVARGNDQVTPIIRRSLAEIERRGRGLPGVGGEQQATPGPADVLDPLADVAAVMEGAARMRTQEVLHLLATRNPTAYRAWTFTDLTAALGEHDAAPYKSGGQMVVSLARVTEALAERDDEGSESAIAG